jgi:hypothetical protein
MRPIGATAGGRRRASQVMGVGGYLARRRLWVGGTAGRGEQEPGYGGGLLPSWRSVLLLASLVVLVTLTVTCLKQMPTSVASM